MVSLGGRGEETERRGEDLEVKKWGGRWDQDVQRKLQGRGLTLWTVGKFGSEELSRAECRHSSLSWLFVLKGFA